MPSDDWVLQHKGNHFAGVIIWQNGEDGREYLVIEYDSGEGQQIKFPGGTNTDHPEETMLETLKREVEEETGLTPPSAVKLAQFVQKGNHLKAFFMVALAECKGTMRVMPKTDDGDKLSPPFWRIAEELLTDPKSGGLFWSHRPALEAAIAKEKR